jgi:hypothetical protein
VGPGVTLASKIVRIERKNDNTQNSVLHERLFEIVDSFIPRSWSGRIVVTVEAGSAKQFVTVREEVVAKV